MKLTCNVPPFTPPQVYATIMVDFKMMKAIHEGSVTMGGEWIIGMRPKIYMGNNPTFHLKYSHHIKEFYTVLPKYVSNYTDFNCGHMAVHYAANKVKADGDPHQQENHNGDPALSLLDAFNHLVAVTVPQPKGDAHHRRGAKDVD